MLTIFKDLAGFNVGFVIALVLFKQALIAQLLLQDTSFRNSKKRSTYHLALYQVLAGSIEISNKCRAVRLLYIRRDKLLHALWQGFVAAIGTIRPEIGPVEVLDESNDQRDVGVCRVIVHLAHQQDLADTATDQLTNAFKIFATSPAPLAIPSAQARTNASSAIKRSMMR
jgi:hypothetical protein